MLHRALLAACGVLVALAATEVRAITNPDISVIGQPLLLWTDAAVAPDRRRPRLEVGEAELVLDAYLNPYARGFFTLAVGEQGLELEEGFIDVVRGLPLGLGLKAGQYRAGFGRLNAVHPHTVPFAERFEVLAAFLPGEEGLVETGVSLSDRVPIHGETSLVASIDWLQGDSFRVERASSGDAGDPLETGAGDRADEGRPAFLGRLAGFGMLGEQSGLEIGASALVGTSNVAARARTQVYGVDFKAKLWTSPRAYLVLQGEGLRLDAEQAGWDAAAGYTRRRVARLGGYVFADYNFALRYDVGAAWERFQQPIPGEPVQQSIGLFAGFAPFEETTVVRADWRRTLPDDGASIDTFRLRVVFSMGPHKAHQF